MLVPAPTPAAPRRVAVPALVAVMLLGAALSAGAESHRPEADGCEVSSYSCPPVTFDAPPVQSLGGPGLEAAGMHSMTQGDFNGDGAPDVAGTAFGGIGTDSASGAGVFLGDGRGGFQAPVEYPAGPYPIDLTTVRLRGAGAPEDLVVIDAGTAPGGGYQLSVLLGNGDGSFRSPIAVPLADDANKVVSADFNHDGKPDLATTTAGSSATTGTRTPMELTVLLGRGDGTFGPPTNYVAGDGLSVYYDMAVGDFNNDHNVDVLGMDPNGLWVSLGQGDGTFAPGVQAWADPTTYLGPQEVGGPTAITVGDLNGDGSLDAALDVDGGRVDVLLGTGTGLFRPAPTPTYVITAKQMGRGSGTLRAVDLTADGHPDLVVSTGYGATLVVLPGIGDGAFGAPAVYPLPSTDDRNLAVVDTNRDGRLDVVTFTGGGFGALNYVTVLLNQGQGRLLAPHQYSVIAPYNSPRVTATNPVGLTLTDLNGDSSPDLVVTLWDLPSEPVVNGQLPQPPQVNVDSQSADTHGSIAVLLGDGHGGFLAEKQYFVGARPMAVVSADLTGDGRRDVAVVNGYSGTLSLLKGNGDGTLQPATTMALGNVPNAIVTGDFNGDHKPDLAVTRHDDNAVSVLLNQSARGTISFAAPVSVPVGVGPSGLVARDFNRDGLLDLATVNAGSDYPTAIASTLSVLLGAGRGAFGPATTTTLWKSSGADAIAAGQFGDGAADLAVANFARNEVKVLHGDGSGSFTEVGGPYGVGAGPESLAVADFNGDGYDDVAVDSINDNTVGMLLGRGADAFVPVVRHGDGVPAPLGWAAFAYPTFLALGDLNGDRRPDLVTANIFGPTVTVLTNTTQRREHGCAGEKKGHDSDAGC